MAQSESPDDGQEKSSAKVVTGVRTTPILKNEVMYESSEAGMSVSEYLEVILLNRHKESPEMDRLTKKVTEQEQEISRLTKMSAEQFQQIEKMKAQEAAAGNKQTENDQLRKKNEELTNRLIIYSDERLLYLFEHVKGKSDTVENAYGDNFKITYQSTYEVLKAILYNTKLN